MLNKQNKLHITDVIINKIIESLEITRDDFDNIFNKYNNDVNTLIQGNYLSHLKSSVETMINAKLLQDVTSNMQKHKKITERIFSIFIESSETIPCYALVDIFDYSAIIYYHIKLTDREKRIAIAHELGHIFIHHFFSDTYRSKHKKEKIAYLFACISLLDRNAFYLNGSKVFMYNSDNAVLNDIFAYENKVF